MRAADAKKKLQDITFFSPNFWGRLNAFHFKMAQHYCLLNHQRSQCLKPTQKKSREIFLPHFQIPLQFFVQIPARKSFTVSLFDYKTLTQQNLDQRTGLPAEMGK